MSARTATYEDDSDLRLHRQRRDEIEHLLTKVTLTDEQARRLRAMAVEYGITAGDITGEPTAENHRPTCRSYLPLAGPCMCTGRNYEWDE